MGSPQEAADDGVKWLALLIAEVCKMLVSRIAKRYPEARTRHTCSQCGNRE